MKTAGILSLVFVIVVLSFCLSSKKEYKSFRTNVSGNKEAVATCGGVDTDTESGIHSEVFDAKCATCHSLEKDGTGPALKNVKNRLPRESNYFELFVRNEDSLIKASDTYALKISKSRVPDYHHNYSNLSEEDWKELENYLK